MSDVLEDDNTAFVVYVPPQKNSNGAVTDATVESCIRLGAGPSRSNNSTTDENTTYADALAASQTMSQLSYQTYQPSSGIALITPGAINLVAAGGVNVTSGSYTNSIAGPSYTVTKDPESTIISASYTDKGAGWYTSSFNTASTISVNTSLLQGNFGFGMTYGVAGPLTCANSWGAMWNSTIGLSVAATFAKVIAVGARTVVSNCFDGSNNEYYTAAQASSTAATFKWMVPVTANYKAFDAMQFAYCVVVEALAAATTVAAEVYALYGLGKTGNPSDVQGWLAKGQLMAGICTAADGLLIVAGLVLGLLTDAQTDDDNPLNLDATTFTIGSGSAVLKTKTQVKGAPRTAPALVLDASTPEVTLSVDNDLFGPMLRMSGKPVVISLGTDGKGMIVMTDDKLVLKYAAASSITLDATGVHLNAGGHSVDVSSTEVSITGQKITIEGAMAKINTLEHDIKAAQTGVAEAKAAAATANTTATEAQTKAQAAQAVAGEAKRIADKALAGK